MVGQEDLLEMEEETWVFRNERLKEKIQGKI